MSLTGGTPPKLQHLTQGIEPFLRLCFSFWGNHLRFLVVVLAAYKQMHAQEHPVLSDVDEKNFDRAFEHFRPSMLIPIHTVPSSNLNTVKSSRDTAMSQRQTTRKSWGELSNSVPTHLSHLNQSPHPWPPESRLQWLQLGRVKTRSWLA